MNAEKLKLLQDQVRIGGKGTVRRKKKVVHRNVATDSDKKLQSSLKKLSVNSIPGIEEVNMIKDDGTVINFINPKVQASLPANTFAITGYAQVKQMTQMLPGILNQLGAENLSYLKRMAGNVGAGAMEASNIEDENEEVPDLVHNFDEVSKNETGAGQHAQISSACCGGAHNHNHKEENGSNERSEISHEQNENNASINGQEVVTEADNGSKNEVNHNLKEENDSDDKAASSEEHLENDAATNGFELITEAENVSKNDVEDDTPVNQTTA